MSKKIFREERLQIILDELKAKQKVYVDDLAVKFDVSPSSIRLDLRDLESLGLITRTYGGAILPENDPQEYVMEKSKSDWRPALLSRSEKNLVEKEAIGKLAASLINDGETIMIDGGSTTQFVAKFLQEKQDLTIVTNAVSLIPELYNVKNAEVYLVGGLIYRDNNVLAGELTNQNLSQFHTMKTILGIDGLSLEAGLTAANPAASVIATAKRKMIAASDQLIIVGDHTKLGITCLVPVAPVTSIKTLVTDSNAPTDFVNELLSMGIDVKIATVSE